MTAITRPWLEPELRLGLVDEKVLDMKSFKQYKSEQDDTPTGTGPNGLETPTDLDSEKNVAGPSQIADVSVHGPAGIPERLYTPDSCDFYTSDSCDPAENTHMMANSGEMRPEVLNPGRRLTSLERRVAGLLNQIWLPTKTNR